MMMSSMPNANAAMRMADLFLRDLTGDVDDDSSSTIFSDPRV
jgi:hypothetical protein